MTESPLLALPSEILTQILLSLPARSLLPAKLVCFELNSIISSSIEIQYHIALETSGLSDNPTCTELSPVERLERLRKGQRAWRRFRPQFTKTVKVQHLPSGIYDLSGGVYLLGSDRMLDLDYAVLPEREGEDVEWRSIELKETYLDMGLCIDEHDLAAVITSTSLEGTGTFDIAIHLKQFSTGQPHPAAKHPRISAYKSEYARPGIGIEIVGDNLVLILSYHRERTSSLPDRLFVFDWRTGALKTTFSAPNRTYSGLIFLSSNLLLLPNTRRGALEIWDLDLLDDHTHAPSSLSSSAPVCVLELPLLAPGRSFGQISCRAEPNPMGSNPFAGSSNTSSTDGSTRPTTKNGAQRRLQRPYRCTPEDAIIIFNVRIQPLHAGPHPVVALGFSHVYSFFVHRKSILRVVEWERRVREHSDRAREWLREIGRAMAMAREGKGDVKGDGDGENDGEGEGRDQVSMQAQGHADLEHEKESPTQCRASQPPPSSSAAPAPEPEQKPLSWDSWGPPISRWIEADDMATRWITTTSGQRAALISSHARSERGSGSPIVVVDFSEWSVRRAVYRARNRGDEEDDSDESDSDSDSPSSPSSPASPTSPSTVGDAQRKARSKTRTQPKPQSASWTLTAAHPIDRAGACFARPVESGLACVCYSSSAHFHYDGALVDEERVLGIKTNALDRIEEFDVLYFG